MYFTVVVHFSILELIRLNEVNPGLGQSFPVTTTTAQLNVVRAGIALA
jgi:hypothetical protein